MAWSILQSPMQAFCNEIVRMLRYDWQTVVSIGQHSGLCGIRSSSSMMSCSGAQLWQSILLTWWLVLMLVNSSNPYIESGQPHESRTPSNAPVSYTLQVPLQPHLAEQHWRHELPRDISKDLKSTNLNSRRTSSGRIRVWQTREAGEQLSSLILHEKCTSTSFCICWFCFAPSQVRLIGCSCHNRVSRLSAAAPAAWPILSASFVLSPSSCWYACMPNCRTRCCTAAVRLCARCCGCPPAAVSAQPAAAHAAAQCQPVQLSTRACLCRYSVCTPQCGESCVKASAHHP